jgi:hypothetical protein
MRKNQGLFSMGFQENILYARAVVLVHVVLSRNVVRAEQQPAARRVVKKFLPHQNSVL